MTESTFKHFFRELCNFFDKKEPPEETYKLWFMEIQDIPDYDLAAVLFKMKRLEWPRFNFPAKVRELWHATRKVKEENLLIDMIMRNSADHGIDWLESFYDLRGPIKNKGSEIGPAVKWLQGNGFRVDLKKLNEPVEKPKFIPKVGVMPFDTKIYNDQF